MSRSARNGEMKAVSTISPASAISRATSPTRRMFSIRSASVKPRSRLSPWRTLSPSSRKVWRPRATSFFSTRLAMVDLPAPRQAGEPQHRRLLALERGMRFAADVEVLAVDVERAAQREVEHPAGDRGVGQLVDQDEPAERAVGARALDRIRFEHDLAVGRDLGDADRIKLQASAPRDARAC